MLAKLDHITIISSGDIINYLFKDEIGVNLSYNNSFIFSYRKCDYNKYIIYITGYNISLEYFEAYNLLYDYLKQINRNLKLNYIC
jgi:hypothetical protein